jgi:hypothetical protein
MKRNLILLFTLFVFNISTYSQTKTVTVDANDVLNNNAKIVAQTAAGQIFFQGHQLGSSYGYPSGIFRALTDNPTGASNYFYDGVANGVTNFSIRADGQGYFAGNIGIGTTTPKSNLHLMGTFIAGGNNANIDPAFTANIPNNLANTGQMLIGWNRTAGSGETDFIGNQGGGGTGGFAFYNHDNSNTETQLMWIQGNGNVAIGTTDPKGYKLAVNGNAIATSMTVKLYTSWPDYVFKKDYQLPALTEINA